MAHAVQSSQVVAPARPVPNFTQLQNWIQLSKTHRVGEADEAVRTLAGLPYSQIQAVDRDLFTLRLLFDGGKPADISARPSTGHALALRDLQALFDLPADVFVVGARALTDNEIRKPDSPPRRAIARILMRAAMLHTDLLTSAMRDELAKTLESAGSSALSTIRVDDAQGRAVVDFGLYWSCARTAMDFAEPTPDGQGVVGDWYIATGGYLLNQRDYSDAKPHLEHARDVLPGEPRLALLLGSVDENLASPSIQALFQGGRGAMTIGARVDLLRKADFQLRSALLLDPALNEARLRLGRVLLLLGRPDEALPMLAGAESGLRRTESKYAAALFSGLAHNELGNRAEAAAAFGRASAIFPDAQSARLALAEMAMLGSNHAEALAAVQSIKYADVTSDPFWRYDTDLVWNIAGPLVLLRANISERVK
jgi:tetratricopeptide (TPR) repeat protein